MEGDGSTEERIKKAAEQMLSAVTSKEATGHFIRAGTEIVLGIDAIAQRSPVPQNVRDQYASIRDSIFSMIKDQIDEDLFKQGRRPGEKKLQKIEFD